MTRNICKVGQEMLDEKAVAEFGSHIARAEVGEEVVGSNFAELWVSLGDFTGDYDAARRKIEEIMDQHPGFQHDLLTYLQERIKEVLSGGGATVVMRIYGPELAKLRAKAQQVYDAIQHGARGEGLVTGVVDLKVEAQVLVPQLSLEFNRFNVKNYGVKPREVADAVYTLVNGTPVAEVHQDQKSFAVHVWGHPDIRRSLADLRRLDIDLPLGRGTVPLAA